MEVPTGGVAKGLIESTLDMLASLGGLEMFCSCAIPSPIRSIRDTWAAAIREKRQDYEQNAMMRHTLFTSTGNAWQDQGERSTGAITTFVSQANSANQDRQGRFTLRIV
jgi:hypothetical protein